MSRNLIGVETLSPHEKRRLKTEQNLRSALDRLVGMKPNHPTLRGKRYRLTVAALAREARVSRNTIYANHRPIVEELDRVIQQTGREGGSDYDLKLKNAREVIIHLQEQKQKLATENAILLKRTLEAEQQREQLKKQNVRLLQDLATARKPAAL